MKSAPVIAFDYRPSPVLASLGVAWLSLAVAAVALCGLPLGLRIGLIFAAIGYATFALLRFLRNPVRRLAWQDGNHWHVVESDTEYGVELRLAQVRGAWIALALRRQDGRHIAVILGPDNSDADTRRRLRVRLARHEEASRLV
jgi:toxin CptA